MLLSAKLHKEFWTELKEEVPDLKKLNLIGAQITETGNSITENYTDLVKINTSSCEVLFIYAHYLILVNEDYAEGREMLANARKIYVDKQTGHRRIEEFHLEDDAINKMTSAILILTADSPKSTPRIKNVNLLFTEITGYQREELIDSDIAKIAPHLYTKEGVNCFDLFSADEEQERTGYINHKFNHLISVQYSVASRPEEGEWHLIFKLTSASSMKMVVLTD
jgi:hypothetical protein